MSSELGLIGEEELQRRLAQVDHETWFQNWVLGYKTSAIQKRQSTTYVNDDPTQQMWHGRHQVRMSVEQLRQVKLGTKGPEIRALLNLNNTAASTKPKAILPKQVVPRRRGAGRIKQSIPSDVSAILMAKTVTQQTACTYHHMPQNRASAPSSSFFLHRSHRLTGDSQQAGAPSPAQGDLSSSGVCVLSNGVINVCVCVCVMCC